MAAPTGQSTSALTTDEAIACIRTAVAAQAGLVKGVEGEDKKGKRLCEVKIVDETGKRHKLHSNSRRAITPSNHADIPSGFS